MSFFGLFHRRPKPKFSDGQYVVIGNARLKPAADRFIKIEGVEWKKLPKHWVYNGPILVKVGQVLVFAGYEHSALESMLSLADPQP